MGLLKTEVATASTSNAGESEGSPDFETTLPWALGDLGEPGLSWESLRVVNLTLSPLRKEETNSYLPCVFSIQNLRMIDLFLPTALLRPFLQFPRQASLTAQRTISPPRCLLTWHLLQLC